MNKEFKNVDKEPIHIKHSELKRVGDSIFRSECPACKEGVLLVARDNDTLVLEEIDRCLLCGQIFIYNDISEMRDNDFLK